MSIYHVPIYDLTKLFANKIPRFLLGFTFCFKNLLLLTLFLRYLCRCHVGILNALSNISMSARFCFCWPSHFYMFLLKSNRIISDEEIKCVFPFESCNQVIFWPWCQNIVLLYNDICTAQYVLAVNPNC